MVMRVGFFFYFAVSAEFIAYKLKEMRKISEEGISVVMEEFKNLDVDIQEK